MPEFELIHYLWVAAAAAILVLTRHRGPTDDGD